MKIYLNQFNNISFKSQRYQDDGVLGYDDYVAQNRRKEIRNWREIYYTPYKSLYERECNLSEYELQKLIATLTKKIKVINTKLVNKIDAYNLTAVGSKGNCFRGSTLKNKPDSLRLLKEAGIKRIIDLIGYPSYKEKAEAIGLEYYCPKFGFDYQSIWHEDAFYKNKDKKLKHRTQASVNRFVKFIEILQKEDFYIGCEYGTFKTDDYILLNYTFNPKAEATYIPCNDLYKLEKMKILYKNLSSQDKERMGWTKEFDENVQKRLQEVEKKLLKYISSSY